MSYQALFYPKSVAIIGASRNIKTVGNDVVKNLVTQGFKGTLYPVNPKADILYGQKVFATVAEIPEQIDLAIIAIPAQFVPEALIQANDKGATAAIVISAGFKEAGNTELEEQVAKVCVERNITLVGPNCLGIINPEIKMNASFAGVMPIEGNVAFVSQSGALCTAVLDYAMDLHIGFSKFMSTGNKAVIDELALLKYFATDEKTKVIAMYVEQLENAPELISVVKQISLGENAKPVIILKSGTTQEGSSAIASHTGSLAGGDTAYDALFSQAGIIRANTIGELFDYVQVFSKSKLVPVENVTIVTNAGGPGVLTTDAVINSGLHLAKLEESTITKLQEFLPKAANTNNPVDVLGDAVGETYQKTLDVLVNDVNTDALLVLLTPQSMTEIRKTAHAVVHSHYYGQKPVLASFMGQETVHPGMKIMQEAGVTTTTFPEAAAKALGVFSRFQKYSLREKSEVLAYTDVDKQKVADIFAKAKQNGKTSFPEAEALEILQAYNFPLLKSAHAKSAKDAEQIAQKFVTELGNETTFAMKIVSQDILHKSDVGGVMLGISAKDIAEKSQELIARVAQNKPEAKLDGVLVMQMAPKNGIEVILGVSKAPGLGTMIMVGLGGIYVEILGDVNFGYVPLTKNDIHRMITALKSAKIFEGARGAQPSDIDQLIESVGRLAQLVTDFPEISELDINPLLVLPEGEGVRVLDARIVL
ncbi:acetate--CoA ligase family protein [Candidatus Woesebacteria bacterium]|nr:acetate--CoA ligase family protein [Candidatus Woesebacteria bacterium]